MTDIERALDSAGIGAFAINPFVLHGESKCFEVRTESGIPITSWQKLRTITTSIGYYPVISADGEFASGKFEDLLNVAESFVPAPELMSRKVTTERDGTESFRRRILDEFDMADATEEQLNQLIPEANVIASIRKKPAMQKMLLDMYTSSGPDSKLKSLTLNEYIAYLAEFDKQLGPTPIAPDGWRHWNALKSFESESLLHFCKAGERPSSEIFIECGEKLDIKKWIALKSAERKADIGVFEQSEMTPMQLQSSKTLLVVPAEHSWHVPAFFRLGNYNENPPAHIHVAMLKRWHEKFGAEIVTIGRDKMSLTVEQAPISKNAALKIAAEQFAYCPDIILQWTSSDTLSGLATNLLGQKVWHFWWD